MVVSVNEEDAKEFSKYGALSLMKLQEDAEKKMFEAADNSISAPSQRLTDFLKNTPSSALSPTSYLCGVVPTNLNKVLPKFISSSLHNAFNDFGRKMKGFITHEANLIGLESRTSSPVRIPRDKETSNIFKSLVFILAEKEQDFRRDNFKCNWWNKYC